MNVLLAKEMMKKESDENMEGVDNDEELHCRLKKNTAIHVRDGFGSESIMFMQHVKNRTDVVTSTWNSCKHSSSTSSSMNIEVLSANTNHAPIGSSNQMNAPPPVLGNIITAVGYGLNTNQNCDVHKNKISIKTEKRKSKDRRQTPAMWWR